MDYINKENNMPIFLKYLDSFFSIFPSPNNIYILCLYFFVIYILLLLIRKNCRKTTKNDYGDDLDLFDEEENKEIKEIKERREKLLKDPEFRKKLELNRKKKAIEAMQLLNKIK